MSDDFYLSRDKQLDLRDTLRTIPRLAEDIAVTLCRMDRITRPGTNRRTKRAAAPEGVNLSALHDWTELHNALSTWVRLVCDDRQLDPPASALISLSSWLDKHVVDLALCEGSDEAPDDIEHWVAVCRRHVDLPPDDPSNDVRAHHAKTVADRTMVTLGTVETVCAKIADAPPGLNEHRLRHLVRRGKVKPASVDKTTGTKFYRLSDVIEAHHDIPQRAAANA